MTALEGTTHQLVVQFRVTDEPLFRKAAFTAALTNGLVSELDTDDPGALFAEMFLAMDPDDYAACGAELVHRYTAYYRKPPSNDLELTPNERLCLGLLAWRGDKGLNSYKGHPVIEESGEFREAMDSLVRFGYATRAFVTGKVTAYWYITEAGARQPVHRGADRYSNCIACVLRPCVCSYSLGCLAVSHPDFEGHHVRTGCTGTHD